MLTNWATFRWISRQRFDSPPPSAYCDKAYAVWDCVHQSHRKAIANAPVAHVSKMSAVYRYTIQHNKVCAHFSNRDAVQPFFLVRSLKWGFFFASPSLQNKLMRDGVWAAAALLCRPNIIHCDKYCVPAKATKHSANMTTTNKRIRSLESRPTIAIAAFIRRSYFCAFYFIWRFTHEFIDWMRAILCALFSRMHLMADGVELKCESLQLHALSSIISILRSLRVDSHFAECLPSDSAFQWGKLVNSICKIQ